MNSDKKYKKWTIITIIAELILLACFAAVIIVVDPYFHYHAPLQSLAYSLNDDKERYQNDGITKHFDYTGIITGTSMTQNFKTSEADALFGEAFIKVPFGGASYKEINENISRGFGNGKNIKYVIRCLDSIMFIQDKNKMRMEAYPEYLYDNRLYNDVNYLLNKEVMLEDVKNVLLRTSKGDRTTSFDEYGNWMKGKTFGADAVLKTYTHKQKAADKILTEEEKRMVQENIRQNVTSLVRQHPETEFYLFFPPYSICQWDNYAGGVC